MSIEATLLDMKQLTRTDPISLVIGHKEIPLQIKAQTVRSPMPV